MEAATDLDWQRLAQRVTQRRNELGMTQGEVQAAGGPSVATMRMIEGALQTSYRGSILGRLERALRWKAGGVLSILSGGEPEPVTGRLSEDAQPLPAEMRRWLAIMADPDVPDATKQRMRDQMRLWVEQIEQTEAGQEADESRRQVA